MRSALLVSSILLGFLGAATCAGTTLFGILNFEPPNPQWSMLVSDATAQPERAKTSDITSADYSVSIFERPGPGAGACRLTVRNATGTVLGRSAGGLCLLSLEGHAGDVWSFEASSGRPDAEIQVAIANPLYPKPLGHLASGGLVAMLFAALGVIAAVVLGRRASETGKEPLGARRPEA